MTSLLSVGLCFLALWAITMGWHQLQARDWRTGRRSLTVGGAAQVCGWLTLGVSGLLVSVWLVW